MSNERNQWICVADQQRKSLFFSCVYATQSVELHLSARISTATMDKKKKRPKSARVDAGTTPEDEAADDWAPFTAPDGRVYYYNQVRQARHS